MIRSGVRRVAHLIALILIVALVPIGAGAAEISIKPGKFSHFNLIAPDSVAAGESATLQLQAVDAYSNIITNFNEQNIEFRLTTTGSANVNPLVFRTASFSKGIFQFTLRDSVAETVSVSVFESASPIALVTKEIQVQPAKVSAFRIAAPRTAGAGEKFDVQITAVDNFGNIVTSPIQGRNLNILFKGDSEPRILGQAVPDFNRGICTVSLISEKIGSFTFEVKDLVSGVTGTSEHVEITNGSLHAFRVVTPRESLAGDTFEVAIVALDAYNNLVRNYSAKGSGVTLSSTGSLKPFPSTILAYEFQGGQARVQLRYDAAEDIQLVVSEISRKVTGKSDVVHIIRPIPSRYDVTVPDSAVAGQRFKVKVTAYNQKGAVIRNYNQIGPDVILNATGTGKLAPGRIPAREFVNGSAVISAQYNRSEAFSITASAADGSAKTSLPSAVKGRLEKSDSKAQSAAKKEKTAVASGKKGKKSGKAKKATKSSAKSELQAILIAEEKASAEIIFHMKTAKGMTYSISTTTSSGKNWLLVKLTPAISSMSLPLRLQSTYAGDVFVDDDGKGGIIVRIELLKPVQFSAQKEKAGLAIVLK